MSNTIKIYLTCPNCGDSNWIVRDDEEAEGAFECAACGELAFPEDMCSEVNELTISTDNIPTEFDITKIITISSRHIEENITNMLDTEPDTNRMGLSVYNKEDYGWFIYIPDYLHDKENMRDIPESLQNCLNFAMKNNCEWLCIDCDGPEYDDLPKYDW